MGTKVSDTAVIVVLQIVSCTTVVEWIEHARALELY